MVKRKAKIMKCNYCGISDDQNHTSMYKVETQPMYSCLHAKCLEELMWAEFTKDTVIEILDDFQIHYERLSTDENTVS